ncbi:MAG: transglycosylase SLT domain-containing protein [Candidatus Eutrophobiaceae bacterium]
MSRRARIPALLSNSLLLFLLLPLLACQNSTSTSLVRPNDSTQELASTATQQDTIYARASVPIPPKPLTTAIIPKHWETTHNPPAPPAPAQLSLAPATDVWERIRNGLSMDRWIRQKSVAKEIAWYQDNPQYVRKVAERAMPWLYHIVEEIEARGMPVEVALLPVVESAFKPTAYSRSHANGLWQFIPATGRRFGLQQNWWYDGRRDVTASTRAALDYLSFLHEKFNGDWLHALAAYNTGENNVQRAIDRNQRNGKDTSFWTLRLPRETRAYVPKLLAIVEILAHADVYGVEFPAIPNELHFKQVELDFQMELSVIANLAKIDADALRALNPGYNRGVTAPHKPWHVLLPINRVAHFLAAFDGAQREKIVARANTHWINRGESLHSIASLYDTTIVDLMLLNKLNGTLIRAGHKLLIPPPRNQIR